MTAGELMSQLAKDKGFLAAEAEREAALLERVAALRVAERPVVEDLRSVGCEVGSVWDLVNTSRPYPEALPVLLDHFERGGYPDRVMESLGRALAVKPAVVYWDRLKARWLAAENVGEEDGAAVALAACATAEQVDDLMSLLSVADRGESRVYFLRPVLVLGGVRGRVVVEGYRGDPVLGAESSALLKRRRLLR